MSPFLFHRGSSRVPLLSCVVLIAARSSCILWYCLIWFRFLIALVPTAGVPTTGGNGKVLKSNATDNVFIFFVDHGGTGIIAFPVGP